MTGPLLVFTVILFFALKLGDVGFQQPKVAEAMSPAIVEKESGRSLPKADLKLRDIPKLNRNAF